MLQLHNRVVKLLMAGMLIFSGIAALMPASVNAQFLTQRSLFITNPVPGATTTYSFSFTYATTGSSVGSVKFQYCNNSPLFGLSCTAPPGLDVSAVSLSQQSGVTGFAISNAQTNSTILSRVVASPPGAAPSQYVFSNAVNPTGFPGPFYVRISTYPTLDASGLATDNGSVVNATTQVVIINTKVPPILRFCVAVFIPGDCSTAQGDFIDLGELSSLRASSGSSQMQAGTNALFGLAIGAYGTTMTSGTNFITPLTNPTVSAPGNSQFGINLRKNTDPGVGQDPAGGDPLADPTPNYNIPNNYTFNDGDTVATSPVATDIRQFTVSYVVNVTPGQPAGVYTSTITYICTATF